MGTTKENFASQSLILLRADTISSFDDGTNEANIVNVMYDDFAQDILSRHPWSFATKKIQLSRGSETPVNEYKYAYVIPNTVLRVLAMYNTDQEGARPCRDYIIQQTTEGRRLLTNEEKVYIDAIFYVAESEWPAYFIHFGIYAFAAHIATPVTDDEDMEAKFHSLAWGNANESERGGKFAVARVIDDQQYQAEDLMQENEMIAARFSF